MIDKYSGNYGNKFIKTIPRTKYIHAMLDLAQSSPPKVKIPTLTIKVIGPLLMKTHSYNYKTCFTSTNNAACKDEYLPEIRRNHG